MGEEQGLDWVDSLAHSRLLIPKKWSSFQLLLIN